MPNTHSHYNHYALADLLNRSEMANERAAAGSIQGIINALREHLRMDITFVSECRDGRRMVVYVRAC